MHRFENGMWWRGLTITTGYRVYNSFRHYIGTVYQVQRQTQHSAVVNHVNLFEADVNYQFTPRLSFIASIPGMEATRHGQSSPLNIYRSGGIGDVTQQASLSTLTTSLVSINGSTLIRISLYKNYSEPLETKIKNVKFVIRLSV